MLSIIWHGRSRVVRVLLACAVAGLLLMGLVSIVVIVGSTMYLVEGPEAGFTSIPRGVYWGIVTLTTVGYGDIAPQTPFGQTLAAMVMSLGYGIIAGPTGIFTAELALQSRGAPGRRALPRLRRVRRDLHARGPRHGRAGGARLHPQE